MAHYRGNEYFVGIILIIAGAIFLLGETQMQLGLQKANYQ